MARPASQRTPTGKPVRIKRAYEKREPEDGYRVLVDRLWPRGLRKEVLEPDEWIRELSPSDELRKWFGHDPERWKEFQTRYRRELAAAPARKALDHLAACAGRGTVTLLYGAQDEEHNNAVVLQALIEGRRSSAKRPVRVAPPSRTAPAKRRPAKQRPTVARKKVRPAGRTLST